MTVMSHHGNSVCKKLSLNVMSRTEYGKSDVIGPKSVVKGGCCHP